MIRVDTVHPAPLVNVRNCDLKGARFSLTVSDAAAQSVSDELLLCWETCELIQ